MPTTNTLVPFDSIRVGERLRRDLGNIDDLAESISAVGLIQPLCVRAMPDETYRLVAGGRRMAALVKIRSGAPVLVTDTVQCNPFDQVPVYIVDHAFEDDVARTLELEENLRRKDMTWQEKVLGIGEIHRLRLRSARVTGGTWTCRQTGDVFGQSHASVVYAVKLSEAILAGDDEVLRCDSAEEAVKTLLMRKKREVEKYRAGLRQAAVAARLVQKTTPRPFGSAELDPVNGGDKEPVYHPVLPDLHHSEIDAYEQAIKTIEWGNSIHSIMPRMRALSVGGIYTDIPYGIDQANMAVLKHFDQTEEAHDMESNVADFEQFLTQSYRVLKDGTWCVFWCDIGHFAQLRLIALKAGFRTVNWPLIAKKNLAKNEAAAFNPTKDYEVCMACARGIAPLATRRSTCFIPWEWADGEISRFTHPFKKPFSSHKWLLDTFFHPHTSLLDPYCGEGTGVLAALRLGHTITGIDMEEHHVDRARQHVADWFKRPDVRSIQQPTLL